MADAHPVAVGDADFAKEIEQHQGLAVVDFWAEWCGPCRMVEPLIEQLASEYGGRVKVAKVDVDANQDTTVRFNVRSIPTVLFFKNGAVVDRIGGVQPKAQFIQKLEQHLS